MLKNNNDFVCVFLTEDELKISQTKGKGAGAKVVNLVSRDIRGVVGAEITGAIKAAIKGINVKSSNVIYVIAPSMTTTKIIEVPSTNSSEIESIVNLQAARHTPFSREEIEVGFINLGVRQESFSKVLLVIANRSILRNQLGMLETAGLKVRKVIFAPEGIAGYYNQMLKLESVEGTTALIDVDTQSTDIIVVQKGLPVISRNIPYGKEHIASEGEDALIKITDELNKTIESYQAEENAPAPVKYLMTSESNESRELLQKLVEKLHWTVEIVPYPQTLKTSKQAQQVMAQAGSFLNVIASGLLARQMKIDLMPGVDQLQKSVADQGRAVFKALIFGLIIIVCIGTTLFIKGHYLQKHHVRIKAAYMDNREEALLLEKYSNRVQFLQDYLNSRMTSLDVISELYDLMPDEIYLTRLILDEDGSVVLQGVADTSASVYNWGPVLKESKILTNVDIKSTKAKKDRGKDASSFEISLMHSSGSTEEMMVDQPDFKEE